jgi:hypothetical protein
MPHPVAGACHCVAPPPISRSAVGCRRQRPACRAQFTCQRFYCSGLPADMQCACCIPSCRRERPAVERYLAVWYQAHGRLLLSNQPTCLFVAAGVSDLPESASEELLEDDDFLKKVWQSSGAVIIGTHANLRCWRVVVDNKGAAEHDKHGSAATAGHVSKLLSGPCAVGVCSRPPGQPSRWAGAAAAQHATAVQPFAMQPLSCNPAATLY